MLIGAVADATGVSTKALRYYEREGLLHEPDRTSGGYRDYSPQVIDRVGRWRVLAATGVRLAFASGLLLGAEQPEREMHDER